MTYDDEQDREWNHLVALLLQVVEEGPHTELLERDGRYADLYHMQFRGKGAKAH